VASRGGRGGGRGSGNRGRGGGRARGGNRGLGNGNRGGYNSNSNGNSLSKNKVRCQVSFKDGHSATYCWYRYDEEFILDERTVAAAMNSYGVDTNWYVDTGQQTTSQEI
jgi:hypothetical protein